MLSEEFPDRGAVGPKTLGGTACVLTLYVADVDKAMAKAEAAGARVLQLAQDQFYGDRCARLEDPVRPRLVDQEPHRGRHAEADAETARRHDGQGAGRKDEGGEKEELISNSGCTP
jgi:hypothetical protein